MFGRWVSLRPFGPVAECVCQADARFGGDADETVCARRVLGGGP